MPPKSFLHIAEFAWRYADSSINNMILRRDRMLKQAVWTSVLGVVVSGVANGQAGLKAFFYPGTNYPTKFTSINESGTAVGWFSQETNDPIRCDATAFGGPCLPPEPVDKPPYGFIYENGKFTRLKGDIVGGPNNKPVWVNNKGKILIMHGLGPNVFVYLLYDPVTGNVNKVGRGGDNGAPLGTGKETMSASAGSFAGINSKNEVVGMAQIVRQSIAANGYPHNSATIGLIQGVAGLSKLEPMKEHGGGGRFKGFDVTLRECPKDGQGNMVFPGDTLQYAGPTDNGLVAFSCYSEAIIFDLTTGKATPIPSPGDNLQFRVMGIANDGSVAGCGGPTGTLNAFVYRAGSLSFISRADNSCAMGINSKGQVVGYVDDKAFIYTP